MTVDNSEYYIHYTYTPEFASTLVVFQKAFNTPAKVASMQILDPIKHAMDNERDCFKKPVLHRRL